MSWAAHQFEVYAIQAHLPKRMRGKVSFFGIWLGDFMPDFLSKFWVYGITVNGQHYGSLIPHQWHRGWPGMGLTHTPALAIVLTAVIFAWRRSRGLSVGFLLGYAAHALTDVNDSVGTMLLFPFSTENWSAQAWAYSATIDGGKYLDAAAYYSSLGLAMDLIWLVVALCSWRVLTRQYWQDVVVAADVRGWSALGKVLPERALLALYRATFFYGLARLVSWNAWARLVARPTIDGVTRFGYPIDLSWTGPWWMPAASLDGVNPWLVLPAAAALLGAVYAAVVLLWAPMGRAEVAFLSRKRPGHAA